MATERIEGYDVSVIVENGKKSWFCLYCNKSHKSKITIIRHIPMYIMSEENKAFSKKYRDDCEKEYKQHIAFIGRNWSELKYSQWDEVHQKLAKKLRDARDAYTEC